VELYLHSPNTYSWSGAYLSIRATLLSLLPEEIKVHLRDVGVEGRIILK
jgi:hypothetical protein